MTFTNVNDLLLHLHNNVSEAIIANDKPEGVDRDYEDIMCGFVGQTSSTFFCIAVPDMTTGLDSIDPTLDYLDVSSNWMTLAGRKTMASLINQQHGV